MNRRIVRIAAIAQLLLFAACAGQPVGGGPERGLLGVELRPIDGRLIDAERRASERGKLSEEQRARARKRAESLRPGVMIVGLRTGGPAEQAGLKVEDVITSANGNPVTTLADLQRALRELRPGGAAELKYLRIGTDGSSTEGIAKAISMSREAMSKLGSMERGPESGGFAVSRVLAGGVAENFDGLAPGIAPEPWVRAGTGDGATMGWQISTTAGAERNVLEAVPSKNEASNGPDALNLCIFENAAVGGNIYMRLRIKAIGEAKSQAGGIVWGYQDEANYYMALLDFARGAVEAYKVVEGKTVLLESTPYKLRPNEWYEIRPEQTNGRIQVWMGKPSRVALKCKRDMTFEGGRVGVVTRGDCAMMFDDISAQRQPNLFGG